MRYAYGVTAALLVAGSAIALSTGQTVGAQVAQNDQRVVTAAAPRAGAPMSFADLTEQLQPAVVNISTKQRVRVRNNPFAGSPFGDLFGNRRGRGSEGETTRPAQSLGSGFIISADGYVVTNNHVVAADGRNATIESITVTMPDGKEYEAELVGRDPDSDLAVLKIQRGEAFPFVQFGDSTKARVGDWIIAIGNPLRLGGTVTSGIISALYRNVGPEGVGTGGAYARYIQTDAAINSGNSGGPMFDLNGNVIGINTAIISPNGGSVGIGFAIPSEVANPIVTSLINGEEIERGFLGVRLRPLDDDLAEALGLPKNRGEFIGLVQDDGPAAKAGIRAGDVVITVDGKAVTPEQTLSFIVANVKPGAKIPIELVRNGKRQTVQAVVEKRPTPDAMAEAFGQSEQNFEEEDPEQDEVAAQQALGIAVQELTANLAERLGLDADQEGVIIAAVDRNSDAFSKSLARGEVITMANGQPVNSPADLEAIVQQATSEGRGAILLKVIKIRARGKPEIFVPVRLRDSN
ncbi:Do family serine endopeptidase [Parasphingorhabdus sp. DH2-15]|uniref:Do family serine endopeptidase n=1 Tax=Parasphingorhabdus sp. DH2-15 TaxID=3444112 RepID=UPI003F6822A1